LPLQVFSFAMSDRVSELQARFLALVQREIGADLVTIEDDLDAAREPRPNELRVSLDHGRTLVCQFGGPIDSADARSRRLGMLASSFAELTAEPTSERVPRPPAARSLHEELCLLTQHARATDALVIDSTSPIVWGAASCATLRAHLAEDDLPHNDSGYLPADSDADGLPPHSIQALSEVRALPNLPGLHRGRQLRYQSQAEDSGLVAHSFAGIYILVLVYEGAFDELRAERSLAEARPHIERLVAALPPLDPTPSPHAGVVSFRPRKRR
jgi:hypothetical protein